jgi:hypothetical protein
MTQYKLIKTPEQFIIVSDEEIKEGDNAIHIGNPSFTFTESMRNLLCKDCQKVIAQQDQIDFNGFEDIVGYFDVEKLSENYIKDGTKHYMEKTNVQLAFIKGFNKANELSSNKQFTLEDMEYCYNTAKRRAVMQEAGLEADLGFKNYIDTYHQQPKEWIIEIAMEQYTQNYHKDIWYNRPLLINDKIQITKIL